MIDEIEKGFASVVSSESDGGLSRRILGRLLGWMQEREAPVFLVATCNQIAALPPELMRKGRFDEIFFIDLPAADERRQIFAIHLARRQRDPAGFDLGALAGAAEGFSGAEIEQAVVAALYTAFARGTQLSTEHILEEIKATRPLSVTRAEEVEALRVLGEVLRRARHDEGPRAVVRRSTDADHVVCVDAPRLEVVGKEAGRVEDTITQRS